MTSDLTSSAINAALCSDWKKAMELNTKILKEFPENIDGLNRLGKALLELGENKKASTIFRKVLKIDRYNQIAQKNLLRSTETKDSPLSRKTNSKDGSKDSVQNSAGNVLQNPMATAGFLEEPGKTRLVTLVNIAPSSILLKQQQPDQVHLVSKRHTVIVENRSGDYLGALPDDLGHRLSILLKGGNTYCGFIKSVSKNSLTVFIREIKKCKKFEDTPSFITNMSEYLSFVQSEPDEAPTKSTTTDEENEEDDIHKQSSSSTGET